MLTMTGVWLESSILNLMSKDYYLPTAFANWLLKLATQDLVLEIKLAIVFATTAGGSNLPIAENAFNGADYSGVFQVYIILTTDLLHSPVTCS